MSGTGITVESLRLSFAGLAPDIARQALDGLDRELAGRLEGRLRSSPAFGRFLDQGGQARNAAGGGGGNGGSGGSPAGIPLVVEARQGMDAGALRALIAERLADLLSGTVPAATPRAGGRS